MKRFIVVHGPNGEPVYIAAASIDRVCTREGKTCVDFSGYSQFVNESVLEVVELQDRADEQ